MSKKQKKAPEVSILVLTYNRRHLLERNLNSIFAQAFKDYEILLLDDCSTDDTEAFVRSLKDPRIRYYRNKENMGSKYGDWWAIRRVIYELMRGKYFIYLCDDDYWGADYVLESLVDKFKKYPNLSLAFGMHCHIVPNRLFHGVDEKNIVMNIANCYTTKEMFPHGYMHGLNYLSRFSSNPCGRNYLEGASLFSREKLIESGSFQQETGTKWQAGYMFKMGVACVGDVFFIDKPYVVAGMPATAQSFSRTQRDHFQDIVLSIADSFFGVEKSVVFQAARKSEKRYVKGLYSKAMVNFIKSWVKNAILWKSGFEFPNTLDVYFQDKIKIGDVMNAFGYSKLKFGLTILPYVFVYNLPASVLFASRHVYYAFYGVRAYFLHRIKSCFLKVVRA